MEYRVFRGRTHPLRHRAGAGGARVASPGGSTASSQRTIDIVGNSRYNRDAHGTAALPTGVSGAGRAAVAHNEALVERGRVSVEAMNRPTNLGLSAVVVAAEGQVSSNLPGEAVVLHLGSGTYFGLKEVGATIWTLLQEPRPISEIRDRILEEYDVGQAQCERDILALLQELVAQGLVDIQAP